MELLVLGANGLLGSNVVAEAMNRNLAVSGTHHSEPPALDIDSVQLDIRDTGEFEALCADYSPDAVINCAAMTDVDGCESHPEQATVVNGRAPGELARLATGIDAAFVQVSTDYVFDGRTEEPYSEDADPNPLQAYGRSKRLGETIVQDSHPAPLIPRLSFVYGRHAGSGSLEGFPEWVRSRLCANDPVPAFTDQHITPTRAREAAATILDLLDVGASGLVHVACRMCCSPYEIAMQVAELIGATTGLIERGQMADVERPAARPTHTCLDVSRVEALLDRRQPTVTEDLERVL